MKRIYIAGLALFCWLNELQAVIVRTDHTNKIFMFSRPAYQNAVALWNRWDTTVLRKDRDSRAAAQGLVFYQKSIDWFKSGAYFLFNCKDLVTVKGNDFAPNPNECDVRAEWLRLPADTNTTLSLNPRQRQAGAIFSYNQDFAAWISHSFFAHLWGDVTLIFSQVKNSLNPKSDDPDLLSALDRTELKYAQFYRGEHKRGGLAEAKLSLGATFLDNCDGFMLAFASGFGIPGERRVRPDYIFEPFLGTNGHFNMSSSIIFAMPIFVCEDRGDIIQFVGTLEHRFYLDKREWRTFDLNEKPWSRYLLIRKEGESATIPATQVLTRLVEVHPHSFVNVAGSFVFTHEGIGLEAGYELWARSDEEIRWGEQNCYERVPRLEQYGIAGTGTNSASLSTIDHQAANDTTFTFLKESFIDLRTGAAPSTGSHRLHAAISYQNLWSFSGSIGGFFEWPHTDGCLKNYGMWGKLSYAW